ncbi:MAG: hypothetical protein OEO77_11920, partial [Acidimicrobiia bacterium]|nr:hypothetical protein [Acidimicrobiia bacterium]
MRQKLQALIRAGARWLFLLIILVLFAAFMPFGHALWSKALGVSGEVVIGATEADGASPGLEYVDAGTACEPEPMVWALVSNVGRADVASATEVELWFGQDPDAALAQFAGLVQLGEIEAGVSLRVSHPASSGSGSYAFRLYQEPGSLSGVATWSDRIEFDLGQCLAVPAEPASTTTTVPSTTTVPVTTTTTTTTVPVTTTTTTTTVPVTTTTTTTTVPV